MQDDSKEKKYAFTEEESNTNYQRLYDIRLCIFATCDEYTIFLRRSKFIKFFGKNNFFRFFFGCLNSQPIGDCNLGRNVNLPFLLLLLTFSSLMLCTKKLEFSDFSRTSCHSI